MSNGFQYRLYEMEVTPPPQVWEKLAADLDEINADNLIAKKITEAELAPPFSVWEKINETFSEEIITGVEKKGIVFNLKRLAAAAVFIGIIISAWFLLFNKDKKNDSLATTVIQPTEEKAITPSMVKPVPENSENKNLLPAENALSLNKNKPSKKQVAIIPASNTIAKNTIQPVFASIKNPVSIEHEITSNKIFDQPIDDLSMVAAGENYMTMVNANGRMVKIPAHLAHLAPHLQNKPITEDYFEILFGEGAYWKEQLNEWRQKLATAPVSSGDIFSSMVELLKSVQTGADNQDGKRK